MQLSGSDLNVYHLCIIKALVYSNYFNCNTDNILHFHVNFQQHSVAFIRLLPQESARIIEKERDDKARGIKEAVHIRILPNMNRDEGRFHLCHLYDDLLGVVACT